MAQKSVELILFRQLANCLALPIFIVDPDGNLIYYNEEAEKLLGIKYSETGEMSATEWATIFEPQDKEGNPISTEKLPLFISFAEHRPAYDTFYIKSKENKISNIDVATFPIVNKLDVFLGAVAFFSEKKS